MKQPAKKWTDEELIAAILGTEAQREMAFTYLYKWSGWKEWVVAHVLANDGDKQEGDEVFQRSVIFFDEKIRHGLFRGESTLQTFFIGIAKRVWFNEKRKKKPSSESMPEQPDPAADIEKMLLTKERERIVHEIIAHLTETCRKVFPLYMLSRTNKKIAEELGLKDEETAKKYAHRCREQFRKFVLQREWLRKLLNIK